MPSKKEAIVLSRADIPERIRQPLDVSATEAKQKLEAIKAFQRMVRENLVDGKDYGVIPGTEKPALLKPGAEKIIKLLNLSGDPQVVRERTIETWDDAAPFFNYEIRYVVSDIATGVFIEAGVGSCNSKETKYRYRKARRICPVCKLETIIEGRPEYGGGWLCWRKKGGCGSAFKWDDPAITSQPSGLVQNTEIFSLVNTILKMAKKRALVDAALSVGRLSDIFTQDIEEMAEEPEDQPSKPSPAPAEGKGPEKKDKPAAPREKPKPAPEPAKPSPPPKDEPDEDPGPIPPPAKPEERSPDMPQRGPLSKDKALAAFRKVRAAMGEGAFHQALKAAGFELIQDVPDIHLRQVYSSVIDYAKKLFGPEKWAGKFSGAK